jgi:hypothetical protein
MPTFCPKCKEKADLRIIKNRLPVKVAGIGGVVNAWPKLPEAMKAGILAMVMAARRGGLSDDRDG